LDRSSTKHLRRATGALRHDSGEPGTDHPGAVRISGRLVTPSGERTFAFELVTDD